MEQDYPAQHSMDTCWFAIDKDGHVAVFDSGEAGAVPHEAYHSQSFGIAGQLARMFPATGAVYDLEGKRRPGARRSRVEHWSVMGSGDSHAILMFLPSAEPVQAEIDGGRARLLPARDGVAVYFDQLSEPLARRLHDAKLCRGCWLHFRLGLMGDPDLPDDLPRETTPDQLAAHGFFHYGHLCENWISGPYGREQVPVQPVHIDQLPPRLRELIGSFHFDSLSFADTPHLQPVEHAECASWEARYLTMDGRELPMPGNEDRAAEQELTPEELERLLDGDEGTDDEGGESEVPF